MNLPNKLTVARVVAVPFYVAFMLISAVPYNYLWALILFGAASITDMIDGKIARKNGLVTDLGKFLDPLADKVLVSAALICMVELGWTASYLVIIIISREFIVSALRLAAASSNDRTVIAAGIWGKLKTAFTMGAICIMTALHILMDNFGLPIDAFPVQIVSDVLMWVSTVLTVISGIVYIVSYRHLLKG